MSLPNMPDKATLAAMLNQPFQLRAPTGESITAELVRVSDGTAMSKRYVCYHAEFALPHGVILPQANYDVTSAASDEVWPLLLAPIFPGDSDRHLLEAVFHVEAKS